MSTFTFENPRFSTDCIASLANLLSDTGNRPRFPDPLHSSRTEVREAA